MKKLLLSLLFAVPTFAQSGFQSVDGMLVWERSFPIKSVDVTAFLNQEPNLKVVTFAENVFNGVGNEIRVGCEAGSGLLKNNCKFDFIIEVHPDKYNVKVTNLKIIEKYGPMQARIMANNSEKYFVDNSNIKNDNRTLTDINCLDNMLVDIFYTPATVKEEEGLTTN